MRVLSQRRLELDYAALPRRGWSGPLLLAAALAVAGHLVLRYQDVLAERSALSLRLAPIDAGRRVARPASARQLEQEARNAETVLRQLALPWPQMIESVEAAAGRQVTLLQLQPDPERGVLRLTAEAGTPEAMLDCVRRLGESSLLSGAHLASHQVQRESPSQPVRFVALASLRDAR